jgi:hypothetical protein
VDRTRPDSLLTTVGYATSTDVDGNEYRVMYTGYNSNLGGNQGRLAAIASPCP